MLILPAEENDEDLLKPKYDFSDLVGRLKWEGDVLAEQKKLRDEWD